MNGKKILDGQWLLKYSAFIIFIVLFMGIVSCRQVKKDETGVNAKEANEISDHSEFAALPSDFREFYTMFHSDSTFQMEHIVFPVKGIPDRADPDDVADGDFYFTADQWILHKTFDLKANDISYINMNGMIIEERIVEKLYGLMIIRRFAKTSGGWQLIYYAGLNKYHNRE